MRQKNAVRPLRAMVRLGAMAAALGALLITAPVGAQTVAGSRATATTDQTGTMAPQSTNGATPVAMGAGNMQPSTMQPASGMMTETGNRGMGNMLYSDGRGFPWGLLGLIGLLGLWPRSRRDRTTVD